MLLFTNLDGANDGAFNNFGWCRQKMVQSNDAVSKFGWCRQKMELSTNLDETVYKFGWCRQYFWMVLSTNLDGAVKRWSCQKMELFTILDGDVKGWCCLQIWMVPMMVPSIILDGAVK